MGILLFLCYLLSKNFQAGETAALFVILQCFLVVAGKLVSFYIVGHFLLLR